MENQITTITSYRDYTDKYLGEFQEYFQLHIFSVSGIVSTYYHPEIYNVEKLQSHAKKVLQTIQGRTNYSLKPYLFQKDHIFLIAECEDLINHEELFEFNTNQLSYEYVDGDLSIFDFLGETKVGDFIRRAFISVGAERLLEVVKPQIDDLLKEQERIHTWYEKLREKDKTSPKLKLEIYKIEKNYIPKKIKELLCAGHESITCLPEINRLIRNSERTTYLIKDIKSGEIIEGNLEQAIENIKERKWQRKHPAVIDAGDMQRMELDNNDQNFLSWDDFVANDDEYEKGDDEYSPRY